MRPTNQTAKDRLDIVLSRQSPSSAKMLAAELGVSVPTIHRWIREHDNIIRQGTTKNARYALRRPLRGKTQAIPIYRIDSMGKGHHIGQLELTFPQGTHLNLTHINWPTSTEQKGWWDGLPYPLYDMRPQGFLGRNFAHNIANDFGVSENPERWSDDDIAYVLSLRGVDCVGDLIIGNTAYEHWLTSRNNSTSAIEESELTEQYASLATTASNLGSAGSSAGGEFPKFIASRMLTNAKTQHVIVKYSGADSSAAVRRWSDLLICEHLALTTLAQNTSLHTADSRVLFEQGRTFLEIERFDRIGMFGRSPVISLSSLDGAFLGSGSDSWVTLVTKLVDLGLAKKDMPSQTLIISWFGKLIANNDMHLGNLSFTFDYNDAQTLRLTPVYDMLPMMYKPLSGGEVPNKQFEPNLPLPQEQAEWTIAYGAALQFWLSASQDTRISQGYRETCADNHITLQRLT